MDNALFKGTPTITVLENRNSVIRSIIYHRQLDKRDMTDERITYHQFDTRGALKQSIDPRLYALQQVDKTIKPNYSYRSSLSGKVLRTDSVDAGTVIALSDIAGRPVLAVNATGVARHWQYESCSLPGRLLSITEQAKGKNTHITERFIWAGCGLAEKERNLVGQCVCHYDTAGRNQTNSIALTGSPLSVARQLLSEGVDVDWQDDNETRWQESLKTEVFTTQNITNAIGAPLISIDAMGNVQRQTYNKAGQLSGSWLTLKGGVEQIILKYLSYSAAGQKLREEHGNGVVTTYRYEPETQWLIRILTERRSGHAAGAKVLQDLRYTYDPVGNVIRITNGAEATRFWRNQKVVPENTYVYDSLYQLVSASGREMSGIAQQGTALTSLSFPLPSDDSAFTHYHRNYRYDRGGNLTKIRHSASATDNSYTTTFTVSNRTNRAVLSSLTENPAKVDTLFDESGHQQQLIPGQALIWTPRGELLKVTPVTREGEDSDSEMYRYDANSQRVTKTIIKHTGSSKQVIRVVYLPGLELRTVTNGNNVISEQRTIMVGEAGRAQVQVLHWSRGKPNGIDNDQLRYSYDNLIGSSGLEIDGRGQVISMEEYYPYGGSAVWIARSQIEADYKTIRYSGKECDATGLYYYGYRYYQPWAGRWLSADPAGPGDGLNLFCMVGNNPVSFQDPDGLRKVGRAARKMVAQAFVHPSHMAVFEKISKEHNIAMSVREAGTFTIKALEIGAAAKGHNILEKTIKPGSLKSVYGAQADSVLKQAQDAGVVGMVGAWNSDGIYGIHVHNNLVNEDHIVPIDLQNPQNNTDFKKFVKDGLITPYTGDYDMHDIIQYNTHLGTVPKADSAEEIRVKDLINQGVAKVDIKRPVENTSMNVVRHGPQVNFVDHMWEQEKDKVLADGGYLAVVAKPGAFPIAMVHQGEWGIFESSEELFDFYKLTRTPVPEHWSQAFVDRSKGIVATPAHARKLDMLNARRAA